ALGAVDGFLAADGVLRNTHYRSVQQTVFGERERVDFDFGLLAFVHKADVTVLHHGFNLESTICRNHHKQRLGGGNHSAYRVNDQLLNSSIDGGHQHLELCS